MSLPRVSIAIVTYNQCELLAQTVASALAQDYPNLEVVVCDDASTDATADYLAGLDQTDRLRCHRNEANLGRVGNYRRALYERVKGDWVIMLDGDDYLTDSGYVSRAMAALAENPGVVMAFGGILLVDGADSEPYVQTADDWQRVVGRDYFLSWFVRPGAPHQCTLYPRELAQSLDFYRRDIISSDWESLRRLALMGDILIHGRVVAAWRRHSAGASTSIDLRQAIADLASIEMPYKAAVQAGVDSHRLERWRRHMIAEYALNYVRRSWRVADFSSGVAFLRHIRKLDSGAFGICISRLLTKPQIVMELVLAKMFGPKAAQTVSASSRRLWRKYR